LDNSTADNLTERKSIIIKRRSERLPLTPG
jgi:hypothetical protein